VYRSALERRTRRANVAALVLFATAFGFAEAATVYYLRGLIHFHQDDPVGRYRVLLNLGFITFVSPAHSLIVSHRVADVEIARESATLVILACLAWVAASSARRRLGAFLVSFSVWDLTYYLFLRIIDHWPRSLFTRDVFFLIPVTSIGPVLTPLVIFLVLLGLGLWVYLGGE